MDNIEVESGDVIKLILQFLKENNLMDSYKVLSKESEVSMNVVEDLESFLTDVYCGRWDSLLTHINTMDLSLETLQLIYEQIIFELLEMGEKSLAKEILISTPCLLKLKEDSERWIEIKVNMGYSDIRDNGKTIHASTKSYKENRINSIHYQKHVVIYRGGVYKIEKEGEISLSDFFS